MKGILGIYLQNVVAASNDRGGYMINWGRRDGRCVSPPANITLYRSIPTMQFQVSVYHNGIFHLPPFPLAFDSLTSISDELGSYPFK